MIAEDEMARLNALIDEVRTERRDWGADVSWVEMLAEMLDEGARLVACTNGVESMSRKFDAGYGATCGDPFTAWTNERVYFPDCYDGSEGESSVPRDPCDEKTDHVGGG